MSFLNKVCYEASTTNSEGVKFSVEEWAEYVSDISYEDAWLKAHELAKHKAEQKLTNAISKLDKKDVLDVIKLTGPPGCPGRSGNSARIPSILNVKELNASDIITTPNLTSHNIQNVNLASDFITTQSTTTNNLNIFSLPIQMTPIAGPPPKSGIGSGTWYPLIGGQFCISSSIINSFPKGSKLYVDLPATYNIDIDTGPAIFGVSLLDPEIVTDDSTPTQLVLTAKKDIPADSNLQLLLLWATNNIM